MIPQALEYVRDLLRGLEAPWLLCGGWAADAWLGRPTRRHGDVDIAVHHGEQRAILKHLPGWALIGHDPNVPDDTTQQWDGRRLDLPAHIHVPTPASPLATSTTLKHSDFEFEFILTEPIGPGLILRSAAWGLPFLAPQAVLLHKAAESRRQDEDDFQALLPTLSAAQLAWLRDSLARTHPAHPWLATL
ncbi:MAG TPA: hypothetical protein VFC19_32835 [Candidatus Limnocylindrales bacterium]|nr:hypothetical protein [Candidatus Limnocylindrales bacterium]